MAASKQLTVQELVEWLGEGELKSSSSAVIAYTRFKANQLLRQEYIERVMSGGAGLIVVPGEWQQGDENVWEYLNATFDSPSLSFDQSDYGASTATLVAKVGTGVQITAEKAKYTIGTGAAAQVVEYTSPVKIRYMSPLNGVDSISTIKLVGNPGGVEGGEIYINYKDSLYPDESILTISPTRSVQLSAGRKMDKFFKLLPTTTTRYVLGKLSSDPNEFFTPTDFEIRIHPLTVSEMSDEPWNDGAILVFIKSDSDDEVSPTPREPGNYLIPGGHTASMILNRKFMLRRLLQRGFATMANAGYELSQHVDSTGNFLGMTFSKGKLKPVPFTKSVTKGEKSAQISGATPELELGVGGEAADDKAPFNINFSKQGDKYFADVTWKNNQNLKFKIDNKEVGFNYFWDYTWQYELSLKGNDLQLELLSARDTNIRQRTVPNIDSHELLNEIVNAFEQEIIIKQMLPRIDDALRLPVGQLNVMRLNQLLFRSKDPVALETMYLPDGVSLFGQVSPSKTRFVIEAIREGSSEVTEHVAIGGKLTVRLALFDAGALKEVKWSVVALNYTGGAGSFEDSEASTLYVAPDSLLDANYITVKINAAVTFVGDSAVYESAILVKVYKSNLMLGPDVQIAEAGKTRRVSVSSVHGEVVSWAMDAPSEVVDEELVRTSDNEAFPWLHTAPTDSTKFDEDEPGVDDKPKVVDLRRAIFFDHKGNDASAYFLVKYYPETIAVVAKDLGITDGKNLRTVELSAFAKKGGTPLTPANGFTPRWSIVDGSWGAVVSDPNTGKATISYDNDEAPKFATIIIKIWKSEMRKAGHEAYGLFEGMKSRRGFGTDPDEYGVVLMPVPWLTLPDIPDPSADS